MKTLDPKLRLLELRAKQTEPNKKTALEFISTGVGCFALSLLQGVGILDLIRNDGYLDEKMFLNKPKIKNLSAVKSALLSLCLCGVINKNGSHFTPTPLGWDLIQHRGLLTMVFDGYGELMAKSINIGLNKIKTPSTLLKGDSIAHASIQFGEAVDSVLVEVVKELNIKGTICDLGCGSGVKLLNLCNQTSLPGLGLDAHPKAIALAKKHVKSNPRISIEQADGSCLGKTWNGVELLMQSFMTHDLYPDTQLIRSFKTYLKNFPQLKYFIIVDIVAPDNSFESHMPAFDYVHGLLGIETRQYDHFTDLFKKAGYEIVKEVVTDLPNTFLWVLKPK